MTTGLNPDCRDAKHGSCSGLGWDLENDQPDDCRCACHDVKGTMK
jgi:hypothetical protein